VFKISLDTHILPTVRFTKGIPYGDAGDALVMGTAHLPR
jgi:hypothetical protein